MNPALFGDGRIHQLTLSDDGVIGVPDVVLDQRVRAVPNPFNPSTRLAYELAAAGPVIISTMAGLISTAVTRRAPLRSAINTSRPPPDPTTRAWGRAESR